MLSTSATLLERLHRRDDELVWRRAWDRFVELYTPLLYRWARDSVARFPGPRDHDENDLVQEVFKLLREKLPEFEYDAKKSFRAWLKTVTLNKWREWCRKPRLPVDGAAALDGIPADPDMSAFEEKEFESYVYRRAMELMRAEFEPAEYRAFLEHNIAGRPASSVAQELQIPLHQVYRHSAKVLARLQQDLTGLAD